MTNNSSNYFRKKFVILGDSGVGKSSIGIRHMKNNFIEYLEPTIGAAFYTSDIKLDNDIHHLEIWDTAGQERYSSLAPMYYRGAVAALIVYDVTNLKSLHSVQKWIEELLVKASKNITIIVLGNKIDLLEKHSNEDYKSEISLFLKQFEAKLQHFYTSCKTGENINEAFIAAVKASHIHYLNEIEEKKQDCVNLEDKKKTKNLCCF